MGTRTELEDWKKYKQEKATAFVSLGYSVSWYPDGDNWMEVYHPQRHQANEPELRASIKFFRDPSRFGIDGGRVSKLTIVTRDVDILQKVMGRPYETVETLFNYDRGADIDILDGHVSARKLCDIVLETLG